MGRFQNLAGERFGRLTVINRAENFGKRTRWNCRCDCGVMRTVVPYHLLGGNTKSCGCLQREAAARNGHGRADQGTPKRTLYSKYKGAALKRGLPFDLSYPEFIVLIAHDCYYCGCPPGTIEPHAVYPLLFNGIDRWNNELGYILTNCVTCCKVCNFTKVKLSGEIFINQCIRVAAHQKYARLA